MTGFAELDDLLTRFVASLRAVLGGNLVGVYLQGSFALGAADEWSDVDFVVVVEEPIADLEPLDRLHAEVHASDGEWARHLEGSYVPRGLLRRVDPERTPVPFLDNGARSLVLDAHCNTAVVRWILHRHGIALAGPPPRELVEPVPADALRTEARRALREYADWAEGLVEMSRWEQPYVVLTLCRILRTIACGDVTSKGAAGEWALDRLPEWRGLIAAALADRPHPWRRVHERADGGVTARTRAFARHVGSPSFVLPRA